MKIRDIIKSKLFWIIFGALAINQIVLELLTLIPEVINSEISLLDCAISYVICLIVYFIILIVIFYFVSNHKEKKSKKMTVEDSNTKNIKKIIFPLIMSIITFLIGLFLSSESSGSPSATRVFILAASFLPFLYFLVATILIYIFRKHDKVIFAFKIMSCIVTCSLLFYYICALFVILGEEATNPITNYKYYSDYVSSKRLLKVFPKEISSDVDNIKFYYAPSFLQGGEEYALYYVDKSMTLDKFDKKYKEKAIWNGYMNDYNENNGLVPGAFSNTPASYKNEDDFIIYLIDGSCYKPNDCNHGDFLFAAFNEKTNEVIYKSEDW